MRTNVYAVVFTLCPDYLSITDGVIDIVVRVFDRAAATVGTNWCGSPAEREKLTNIFASFSPHAGIPHFGEMTPTVLCIRICRVAQQLKTIQEGS
jgi:hypothetical protein